MKRIIFSLAFFVISLRISAQQEYFMFIQEEAGQPFYVRIGEKNYSSSSVGHVLISSLRDSVYQLAIGFPKDRYPEQSFSIVMNREDRGFDLKHMPEGWALFDFRHLEFIRSASGGQAGANGAQGVKRTDAYSQLMAGLVDDSAVLYAPAEASAKAGEAARATVSEESGEKRFKDKEPQERQPAKGKLPERRESGVDTIPAAPDSIGRRVAPPGAGTRLKPAASAESDLTGTQVDAQAPSDLAKSQPGRPAQPNLTKTQQAILKEQLSNDIDSSSTKEPAFAFNRRSSESEGVKAPAGEESKEKRPAFAEASAGEARKTSSITQLRSHITPEWSQFIYIDRGGEIFDTIVAFIVADSSIVEQPAAVDTPRVADPPGPSGPPRLQVLNSDCRNFAGGQDVDKLRVKMLSEKEVYRRSMVARVAFKAKCYSVKQVRALSELFEDDAGRYQFLETAYPYVSDTYNFADLVDLFKTEYYIDRFKKLTGK
ncbi:MAG TPA: DUF4476 domain-containing protein [Flavitalea sp.]|nr:DUF4476 domain-containing protein [Flavitalea sp.]